MGQGSSICFLKLPHVGPDYLDSRWDAISAPNTQRDLGHNHEPSLCKNRFPKTWGRSTVLLGLSQNLPSPSPPPLPESPGPYHLCFIPQQCCPTKGNFVSWGHLAVS